MGFVLYNQRTVRTMWPSSKKVMPLFYYVGTIISKILMVLLTRRHVYGKENVPREGPLIVVANHLHNADPPLLSASLPREIAFMAKEELFHNFFSRIIVTGFGAFRVHRRRYDRQAIRQAEEVVKRGAALGLFPEGSRSPTGQLQEALPGSALIALRLNVPILPVGITGTERIKGGFSALKRPVVKVNIGHPFQLSAGSRKPSRAEIQDATGVIMSQIAELLPREYRGVYHIGAERDQ